ncbi:MAG TPA: Uma2 family endonuclease [Acidimicrobiales bacterium]
MAMADARMTAEDYFDAVAGVREPTQLIDGVIVVNQPRYRHQRAAGLIYASLLAWVGSPRGRGVVSLALDVVVDRYDVYAPDVLWVADADRVRPDEPLAGLPDIAVEVRSPSTWRHDLGVKRSRYEQHGLPELWLVDTAAGSVRVLRRSTPACPRFDVSLDLAASDALESPLLPGYSLPVAGILDDE